MTSRWCVGFLFSLSIAACSKPGGGGTTPATGVVVDPNAPVAPVVAGDNAIDAAALEAFMRTRFAEQIRLGLVEPSFATALEDVLGELADMDIRTTGELNALIDPKFDKVAFDVIRTQQGGASNFTGLLRDIFLIANLPLYAEKAWKGQFVAHPGDFPIPNAFGISDDTLLQYGIISPSGGFDEVQGD